MAAPVCAGVSRVGVDRPSGTRRECHLAYRTHGADPSEPLTRSRARASQVALAASATWPTARETAASRSQEAQRRRPHPALYLVRGLLESATRGLPEVAAARSSRLAQAWAAMNSSARRPRVVRAVGMLSNRRSKKLCGAPSYVTTWCSTPAAVSAARTRRRPGRDRGRRACLQGEDRRLISPAQLDGAGLAVALAGHAVEADGARESVAARRGEPGVAAAEAEADGEDAVASRPPASAARRPRRHVGLDDVGRRSARRAPCTGSRRRACRLRPCGRSSRTRSREAALGEAQGELLVEAVEAAHVGQDDDADVAGLLRRAREGRERVPSAGRGRVLVRDGGSGDGAGSAAASRARSTCPESSARPDSLRPRRYGRK